MCCLRLSLRLNNLSHSSHLNSLSPEGKYTRGDSLILNINLCQVLYVSESCDSSDTNMCLIFTHHVSGCVCSGCCCSGRPCCRGSSGTPSCALGFCVSSGPPCCQECSAGRCSLLLLLLLLLPLRPPARSSPSKASHLHTSATECQRQIHIKSCNTW